MFMLHIKVQVSFLATYQRIYQIKLSQRKFMVIVVGFVATYMYHIQNSSVAGVTSQSYKHAIFICYIPLKCNITVNEFDWKSIQLLTSRNFCIALFLHMPTMYVNNKYNKYVASYSLLLSATDGILPINVQVIRLHSSLLTL